MVVLPPPLGPTRATSCPGYAVKLTACRTGPPPARSPDAVDSRERSETSSADGYEKATSSNWTSTGPSGNRTGCGACATSGCRSSTSKTRSKDTSAVMTSTRTLDRAVSGP